MNRLVALLLLLLTPWLPAEPERKKPNLLIVLADDLGYSDIGCFGGEMSTPSIDRLAKEGIRLTRFHNGGMCVVSRASMLTGQWWPRALPEFTKSRLLSERLHDSGYRTGLIGKWHLPGDPMDRGFDHFFGFLEGFADHFSGAASYRLDRGAFRDFGPDFYSSDALSDRAVRFIRDSRPDQPFFLYLSYQAPHNPLQAPDADILKHRGHYLGGWQSVREARFRRQKEMGLVPADAVLPAYPQNLPEWSSLSPEQKDLEDLRMAVFAAMIERMDQGIGRVMEALKASGQADNTLVLFMSDNGADSFSVADAGLLKAGLLPGDRRSNWQLGTGWAYASVTPWRLYKISQHAGGITSGGIAWWPAKTVRPGRIESSPVHLIDVLPTFLTAAGVEVDSTGESFLPLLQGEPWKRKDPLFFQYLDNRSLRTPEWTLAEVDAAGWELYHASIDPLETRNVLAENPGIARDLESRWMEWWRKESGRSAYQPESSVGSQHYKPQGDRGSGQRYVPSAMPAELSKRRPIP